MSDTVYQPGLKHTRLAVSPLEGATLAGIGRTKFYEVLNAGLVPSFKIGTRRLILVAEIEAWLKTLENAGHRDGI